MAVYTTKDIPLQKRYILIKNLAPANIVFLWVVLHLMGLKSAAQDMTGIVSDRYSGVNRGIINPANLFDSPNCLDISLVTGSFGVQNNYFYLPRGDFNPRDILDFRNTIYENRRDYFSERVNIEQITGFQYARLQGPSVLFKYKNHAFAFTNSIRAVSSARRLPQHVLKFTMEGLTYTPQIDILFSEPRPFSMATMSWAEVGIGYATNLSRHSGHELTAGITLKRLWSYHSLSIRSDDLIYFVDQNRDIFLLRFNSTAMGALPLDYNNMQFTGSEDLIRGKGFAFDLGISFTQNLRYRRRSMERLYTISPYEPYIYRIGFSLLDFGAVQMKENIRSIIFEEAALIWNNPNIEEYGNIDELIDDMESGLVRGEIRRTEGEAFTMYLPSAASVQFDYNLGSNFFAYFLWVQDLPVMKNRLARPSYVGFIPRYETRWFSLAIPMTLYEYRKPGIGVSMRLGVLTIGTEQPGGMLHLNDMDGMDIYFSISFGLENCSRKRGKINPCFNYWR